MKRLLSMALLLAPVLSMAQDIEQPPVPSPEVAPPPPLASPVPPSQALLPAPENGTTAAPPVAGQWVYTDQYGWVWMPYGAQYTYLPPGGAAPDMFVYYPAYGWRWVVAPWVWGLGPRPYFGVYGVVRFPWYGRGFGHWYGFAPRYHGWVARGYWVGNRWASPRFVAPPHPIVRGGHVPERLGGRGWYHGHR
jgi:hypothetical protein